MKKLFIILAAAALAVNVNAAKGDMVLSGSLGFATGDNALEAIEYTPNVKGTMFEIAPNFTYFLTDKFGVGGKVSFASIKPANTEAVNPVDGSIITFKHDALNEFGVGVFGRYYFFQSAKFGIFAHAGLDFVFPKNTTDVTLGVAPGIQYFINKKWSIETSFNNVLFFNYNKVKDTDGTTNFGLLVNPFELAFNPLTLTLNYHF